MLGSRRPSRDARLRAASPNRRRNRPSPQRACACGPLDTAPREFGSSRAEGSRVRGHIGSAETTAYVEARRFDVCDRLRPQAETSTSAIAAC